MKLGRRLVGLHKFLKPPVLLNSVLNVKTPVGAFNQEKALVGAFNQVGAFTVIVKTDGLFAALVQTLVSRVRHNNAETRVFNLRSCCSGPLTTI